MTGALVIKVRCAGELMRMGSRKSAEFQQVEVDWIAGHPNAAKGGKVERSRKDGAQFTRPNGWPYKLHAINKLRQQKTLTSW
jgi:hypothetical protein